MAKIEKIQYLSGEMNDENIKILGDALCDGWEILAISLDWVTQTTGKRNEQRACIVAILTLEGEDENDSPSFRSRRINGLC